GSVAAMCAPSFYWLLGFRALQGLSAGAGSVVGRAVIRDLFPGQMGQKVMSYVTMVFSLAPAVAPVVGGWLQVCYGWRAVFAFLSLASLAMWIAAWKVLPESLAVENRAPLHLRSMIRGYWRVASHGDFLLQSLGIGLGFAGFSLYISTGSDFVMHVLHLPETAFAWLFIPIIIGMSAGSALSARLAMKFPPTRLIWIAYCVMATATIANLLYANLCTPSIPWAVLPGMVYMFGLALGSPAMTLRTMDLFPAARGLAASLQGFVQMLLFALMSAIVAPLVLGDIRKLALSVAIGWALSVLCWRLGTRKGLICHREVVEEA
ncbi:MAG: MFS transporter, partial [Luteolibacter sp.]